MGAGENCYNCVYSHWDRQQAMWTMGVGFPARPMCGNHPDFPGRMGVRPVGRACRNFRPRPPTPQGETVKTISLGDGYYAYVDAADYEWLSQWNWQFQNGYAARRTKHKLIYMHREIMKPPAGKVVDHKNRNKLDNTRANLRNCTKGENTQNTGKQQGTSSRFKGVCRYKGRRKWVAKLDWQGQPYYRGYFNEEIEAARAYDYKTVELMGEAAWVNLPEEWPPERRREVHARWQKEEGQEQGRQGRRRETGGKRRSAEGKRGETCREPSVRPKRMRMSRRRQGRSTHSACDLYQAGCDVPAWAVGANNHSPNWFITPAGKGE